MTCLTKLEMSPSNLAASVHESHFVACSATASPHIVVFECKSLRDSDPLVSPRMECLVLWVRVALHTLFHLVCVQPFLLGRSFWLTAPCSQIWWHSNALTNWNALSVVCFLFLILCRTLSRVVAVVVVRLIWECHATFIPVQALSMYWTYELALHICLLHTRWGSLLSNGHWLSVWCVCVSLSQIRSVSYHWLSATAWQGSPMKGVNSCTSNSLAGCNLVVLSTCLPHYKLHRLLDWPCRMSWTVAYLSFIDLECTHQKITMRSEETCFPNQKSSPVSSWGSRWPKSLALPPQAPCIT